MPPKERSTGKRRSTPAYSGTSFVITLWLEPTEEATTPEWRWRVTEGQNGEQRYFRRVADLLSYVSERTELPPPA